jgi:hypothetical protein
MGVAHGHLKVCVGCDFAEGGEVDSGHGHASLGRVAEVGEAELRTDCGLFQCGNMSLAEPTRCIRSTASLFPRRSSSPGCRIGCRTSTEDRRNL